MQGMKVAAGALVALVGLSAVTDVEAARRGRGAARTPVEAASSLQVERTVALTRASFQIVGGHGEQATPLHVLTLARETIVRIDASSPAADLTLRVSPGTPAEAFNDDYEGLGATIVAKLPAGTYPVVLGLWPEVLETGERFEATFSIREATQAELEEWNQNTEGAMPFVRQELATTGAPTVTLRSGQNFAQSVPYSGRNPADASGVALYGFLDASRPSQTFEIPEGVSGTLVIKAAAGENLSDPHLLLLSESLPNQWNDDSDDSLEPELVVDVTGPATFHIWVGNISPGESGTTRLSVTWR